jgi:hypothetical protein
MRRAIFAFAILIALSHTATAGVPLFGHVSCAVVRFYVAKYSEAAAEKWARSQGASSAEIETARRCLHSTVVQTASSTAKPEVPAPVTAEERANHDRAERDPNQEVLHGAPVQGRRADPEQEKSGSEPAAHGLIRAKYTEDRSASSVSHEAKDPPPAARKTTVLHRNVGAMYHTNRAGMTSHVSWLKRLWHHLTRPRQFSIAFLHFKGGRW